MEQHKETPSHSVCIAVIGMNGVGKSSFGKSLASKLRMKRIDTDTVFRKAHGKEQDFIDRYGWEAFRKEEETIVCRSLLPEHVVVLGGGAIESAVVREALKKNAITLWLQGGKKRTHRQLKAAKNARPEFSEGLSKAAVQTISDKRQPLYEGITDIVLFPHLRFSEQVPKALELLKKYGVTASH